MSNLLLISNSTMFGLSYLEHVLPTLQEVLVGKKVVHFIPFALADHAGYTEKVRSALKPLGIGVIGVHQFPLFNRDCAERALDNAEAIFVGGGNSFRLLKSLQETHLLQAIRRQIAAGDALYIGSSAGTNMACPTLRTTNDMPIVRPRSFKALGLIPFQINPHYLDPDPSSKHKGETREERIDQFLEENDVPVLGMREGCWLRRTGEKLLLGGLTDARLFTRGNHPQEFKPGSDLSFLLGRKPRFDSRR